MNQNKYYFISYSSHNEEIARTVCSVVESEGHKCFFAPRDIKPGNGYAGEIIRAIEKSDALLLVMTKESIASTQVLREINAAVSRNIMIVPLKFEDVDLSSDMQYYLGVSQWIDMRTESIEKLWKQNAEQVEGLCEKNNERNEKKEIRVSGVRVMPLEQMFEEGFTPYEIAMRQTEIDYLCIPPDKFVMNDETEGTLEEWAWGIEHIEYDSSACLIKDDSIIGYCDVYPVKDTAFADLISGKCIIRDDMVDVFGFGGEFNIYISMIAITPSEEGHANYYRMIDWVFEHLEHLRKIHVKIKSIGISVYSDMLEAFLLKLNFKFATLNPAQGKVYVVDYESLIHSDAVKNRYSKLNLWDYNL